MDVINLTLAPIRIFERSLFMSGGVCLLRASPLPDIQVALYTFFPHESPHWGWLYLEISPVWDYPFTVRSHDMTWTTILAGHITFPPQHFSTLCRAGTLLLFCDLILCDLLRVWAPYLWHAALFITVVMSFECPMFMPLSYVGGHNHAYSFLSNRHFV